MTRYIRAAVAPLALAAVLTGCGKNDQALPESRQVELTPKPVAEAQLGDTTITPADVASEPAREAPVSPAKKPAPVPKPAPRSAEAPAFPAVTPAAPQAAAAAPATGLIAGGLTLGTALGARVCTNTHKVGDRVTATLAAPVPGTRKSVV